MGKRRHVDSSRYCAHLLCGLIVHSEYIIKTIANIRGEMGALSLAL
jgi:hypothetical protein